MGIEAKNENKLYIRLPIKIKDEFVVRDLHPNILQVHLPRQKSRRWCLIEFESREKLQETVEALKKVKINNKSIKISKYTKGKNINKKKQATDSIEPLLKLLKKSS
ncbi:hypothetical protein JTB14_028500 [Gonioctena quinquepunctata]|nr:hypothetical protein JTB14_028500 [Gonioctena quinquepunctata]